MMHRTSVGIATDAKGSSAGSTHSTPRLTPCSSCNALPTTTADLPPGGGDDHPSVSPPVQPLPHPPEDADGGVRRNETKTKKKEKREKKGRPQNALSALASAIGGGASASPNVVDLRSLDTSLPPVSSKRNLRTAVEEAPPTQILSFLFLGSVKDAQDPAFLAKHHIRYIINVSQEEYWSVDNRVQVFTFKVDDSATADIASLFAPTRSLINKVRERYYRSEAAGKTCRPAVLVHCQKGRSRSATIVLAYLIYTNGWSVAEAMKYVATRRPCAEPNIGFMEELRKLQESLTTDERTKRYSELCWFMRNLDPQTAQAQVRETFEERVGMVRDVVMLTAPGAGPINGQGSAKPPSGNNQATGIAGLASESTTTTTTAADEEGSSSNGGPTKMVSFSMSNGDDDDEGGASSPPTGSEVEGTATQEESSSLHDVKSRVLASLPSASTTISTAATIAADPSATTSGAMGVTLCFVFLTCREDILRGLRHGQLRDILEQLRPAPGKHIKFATGPKLRRLMTEHQSMSSSFAQDMAPFDQQLPRGPTDAADAHSHDEAEDAAHSTQAP